jgi:hypothetical protein
MQWSIDFATASSNFNESFQCIWMLGSLYGSNCDFELNDIM